MPEHVGLVEAVELLAAAPLGPLERELDDARAAALRDAPVRRHAVSVLGLGRVVHPLGVLANQEKIEAFGEAGLAEVAGRADVGVGVELVAKREDDALVVRVFGGE